MHLDQHHKMAQETRMMQWWDIKAAFCQFGKEGHRLCKNWVLLHYVMFGSSQWDDDDALRLGRSVWRHTGQVSQTLVVLHLWLRRGRWAPLHSLVEHGWLYLCLNAVVHKLQPVGQIQPASSHQMACKVQQKSLKYEKYGTSSIV